MKAWSLECFTITHLINTFTLFEDDNKMILGKSKNNAQKLDLID